MPPVLDTLRGRGMNIEWPLEAVGADSVDNRIVERTNCLPSLNGVNKPSDNYLRVEIIAPVFRTFVHFWLRPLLLHLWTCNHQRLNI